MANSKDAAMSTEWSDSSGGDALDAFQVSDERSWAYCMGARFRSRAWYLGYRIGAPSSDALRRASGLMTYEDELVLRLAPLYHLIVAANTAFLSRYLDADGVLPGLRRYTIEMVSTWE